MTQNTLKMALLASLLFLVPCGFAADAVAPATVNETAIAPAAALPVALGLDSGAGFFTGGLGKTNSTGFTAGVKLLVFLERPLAFELAGRFNNSLDQVSANATVRARIATMLIPFTAGARYYFELPPSLSAIRPYAALGVGAYIRSQEVVAQEDISLTSTTSVHAGAYAGAGFEVPIYADSLTLGLDARFHYILFGDRENTFGGVLRPGDRDGNYLALGASLNWFI